MKNRLLLTVMCFLSVLCMKAEDVVFVVDGIKYSTGIEYDKDRPAEGIGVKVYADETLYKELTEVVIPDEVTYEDVTYKVVELGSNLNYNGASSKVQKLTIGANVKTIVSPLGKDNLKAIRFMGSEAPTINTASSGAVAWSGITAIAPNGVLSAYQTAYNTIGFKSVVDANTLHAKSIAVSPVGNMHVGDTKDIVYEIVKFDPSDATPLQVNWTSSNTSVATVDANGHIEALAEGTTTITGQTNDAGWAITSFEVKVVGDISIPSTLSLYRNQGITLVADLKDKSQIVTWESSAPTIAHVDQQGHLSGLEVGSAVITASLSNGKTATCNVTVSSNYFEGHTNLSYPHIYVDGIYYLLNGSRLDNSTSATVYKKTYQGDNSDAYVGDVVIPESVSFAGKVYPVTAIRDAFKDCSGLTSVIIPHSVVRIEGYGSSLGSEAWHNCTSLTSITIPNSVTYITGNPFKGCSYLTELIFEDGSSQITTNVKYTDFPLKHLYMGRTISTSSFEGNATLESVELTKSNAFVNCTSLKSVILHTGSIDSEAFKGCTSLTNVTSDGIQAIRQGAFYDCKSLLSANFPQATTIAKNAFYNCTSLSSVALPSVTSIDADAFYNCGNIEVFAIPETLKSMTAKFLTGTNLDEIRAEALEPASLSSADIIPYSCPIILRNSTALEAYTNDPMWGMHKSQFVVDGIQTTYAVNVNAIDDGSALLNELGLEVLQNIVTLKVSGTINSYDLMIMRNQMPNLKHLDLSESSIVANSMEYYTGYHSEDNKLTRYALYKNLSSLALPLSLTEICDYAFYDLTSLRQIEIPANVVKIGKYAAQNKKNLKSLTFADGSKIDSIDAYAFNGTGIESLSIPASCTYIGGSAISSISLKSIIIEDSDEALNFAGIGSNSLKYMYIGRNIKGGQGFMTNCGALRTVVIGEGVTSLSSQMFSNCDLRSTDIYFPSTLQSVASAFKWEYTYYPTRIHIKDIRSWCQLKGKNEILKANSISLFLGDELIENLVLPKELESISEYSFYNISLNSLTIPRDTKITEIPAYAFANTNIKEVQLPSSIRAIGASAFQGCLNLEEIHLSKTLQSVGEKAFYGCTGLKDVYAYNPIPTPIAQNTFSTYTTTVLHFPGLNWQDVFNKYFFNTQWNQFLYSQPFSNLVYPYLCIDNDDLTVDSTSGALVGEDKDNPSAEIGEGAGFIADGIEQPLDEVHIKFNGTTNTGASLIGKVKANKIYLDLEVKANFWYAFCFPFNVDLKTIQKSGGYVFRYYDGQKRANGGSGWSEIAAGTEHLNAGEGYIFRTNEAGTLTIVVDKKTIDAFDLTVDKLTALNSYTATSGTTSDDNKSWNFVGNPYLSYFDMNDLGYTAPVVTFNGTTYEALRPGDDEQVFYPFQAFFVQKPENVEGVGFGAADQTTYIKSQNAQKKAQARARKADALNLSRKLINLTLTDGTVTDKTRVVFNDEQKMTYEAECDAAKFSSEGVPQFFSLDAKGTKYAINERPMADGVVKLGFTVPAPGEYTISATRMDAHVFLKDNQTGRMHDLSEGDYTFTASKGSDVKRFELVAADEETAISRVDADRNADEAAYDLNGRRVAKTQKGVNIVNGKKVMVK